MQHLGGADAVEDLAAVGCGPALADLGRQGLAGADADAQVQFAALAAGRVGQQRGEEGGHAVEDRRLEFLQRREHIAGGGPRGQQHRRRADAHREGEGVAQPIGEEQLGRGDRRRRSRGCPARRGHRAPPSGSGGCAGARCPWACRWSRWNRARSRRRRRRCRPLAAPCRPTGSAPRPSSAAASPATTTVLSDVDRADQRLEGRQQRLGNEQRLRARVAQHEVEVFRGEQRVGRDRAPRRPGCSRGTPPAIPACRAWPASRASPARSPVAQRVGEAMRLLGRARRR